MHGASPPLLARSGGRYGLWAAPVVAIALWALAAPARADVLAELQAPFREAVAGGNWALALALGYLAGLFTALTPCVYPMIAITVSVFGAQRETSRGRAALLSGCFVLGIAALLTPLGLFASLTGKAFGSLLSSPVVLWAIAALLLLLAASLFGAFELDLPVALKTRLADIGGFGPRGAFLLGLASAPIAAPCTGPVLGVLLTWIASSGSVLLGAAALFCYSLGLGTLFWIVGTFSLALPKSGRWLEWVKSFFGIVLAAAALYFVRDLVPGLHDLAERSPRFLLSMLGLAALSVALGAIHLGFGDPSPLRRLRKGVGVLLAVLAIGGLVGYCEALPPGARIEWREDWQRARETAGKTGAPLMIDFTASWCGACGELDRETFSHPLVVRESRRFVCVRVDLSPSRDTPAKQALLAGYGQPGLPLVVLHESSGKEAARVTSKIDADEMLSLMRKVR